MKNILGMKFGRLLIVSIDSKKGGHTICSCTCDCGKSISCTKSNLTRSRTRSCGCLRKETLKILKTKHGAKSNGVTSSEYASWQCAKQRCINPENAGFRNYGGRGITMCKEWMESFNAFKENMGNCPIGCTLERMNNDKGYEPGNCIWATRKVQGNNTRRNRKITLCGESRTISQWSERMGFNANVIGRRLKRGWSEFDAINKPLQVQTSK